MHITTALGANPKAQIHSLAFLHNFEQVKTLAPQSKVLAMLKGNAYGHGLIPVAKILKEADAFALARLSEAKLLREAGISKRLVIMSDYLSDQGIEQLVELNCDWLVHSRYQIEQLQRLHLPSSLNIWLKIETGMNRLGLNEREIAAAYQQLRQLKFIKEIIATTHFSDADHPNAAKTYQQIEKFKRITQAYAFDGKTAANSGGILFYPEAHFDWVRPGIMLYGCLADGIQLPQGIELKPAMTLSSQLIAIKELPAGERVGYGSTWKAERDSRIAIVEMGYGDGYPRVIQPATPVLIQGQKAPIVGRVCMDMMHIDVSDLPQVKIGDEVIFWGPGLSADEVARYANTISYELFCRLTSRVVYQYDNH